MFSPALTLLQFILRVNLHHSREYVSKIFSINSRDNWQFFLKQGLVTEQHTATVDLVNFFVIS